MSDWLPGQQTKTPDVGKDFMNIVIVVFIVSSVGTFAYFESSLWLLVNLIVSGFVGLTLGFGIFFTALFLRYRRSEGNSLLQGVVLIILGLTVFFGMRSCFYVSSEDRAARIAERTQKEEVEKEQRRARSEAAQKRDEQETADFLASGQDIKIYGASDSDYNHVIQARGMIRRIAHDPESVTDVEATSKYVRLRMKEYPNCRYALSVRFRAKNAFGGAVLQEGHVLFDGSARGIAFLPNLGL